MAWRRLRSLRTRLLWLVLLTLAPVIALHVVSALEKQRMACQAIDRGMQSIADLAAGNARILLASTGEILHGLTHLPELQRLDPAGVSRVFAQAKEIFPNFARLLLVRPDGSMVTASDLPEVAANFADRSWLRRALANPDLTVSSYQVGKRTGQPGIILAHTVTDAAGTVVGVCSLALGLDWFTQIFAAIRMPEAVEACLFDDQGVVLATWPVDPAAIGRPLPDADLILPSLAGGPHPEWSGPGLDKAAPRAVYSTVGAADKGRYFIRLSQPGQSHAAVLATSWRQDMFLFGLAVALALAAAHLFNRTFLLRPAQQLVDMAQGMAAGDLDCRSGLTDGQGELADLGRALDTMADRLRERIRFTQELIDAIPAPLFYKDLDGRYLGCNKAYERDIRPHAAIIGRTVDEIESPERAALCLEKDRHARQSPRNTVAYETTLEYRDGSLRDLLVFKSLFCDVAGRPAGIVGVILDITARKRSEMALLASQTRYRHLLASMHDGFIVLSSDYRLVKSNPAFQEMLGFTAEELSGMTYRDITPPDWQALDARLLAEVDARGFSEVYEEEYRRKDGTIFPVALRLHRHPTAAGDDRRYFAIVRDITEVKATQADLRQAKVAAETANRVKSEFLAKMSHEIRTPLHAVIGMTELTLGTELSPQQRDALETAREAAGNLLDLINDILDISRIEARRLELASEDFDLRRTLASVARTLRPQAMRKGLTLSLRMATDVPRHARGDAGRLRQILLNLVGNAVKFTEGGGVDLAAAMAGPLQIELTVADTGVGIPADRLESVFDMFTQADASVSSHYGGTGLGLAICRELTRLMGGVIEAQSTLGRGSVFRLRLPLQPAQAAPPAPVRDAAPTPAPSSARSLRVLLAEDNPVNVKVATTYLSRRGHAAVIASDGRRALELLAQEPFDLVLMDIEMPELDGMEATRRLRAGLAGPKNRDVPVVAMTAHALSGAMERCLAAGMSGYLPKPLDFKALDAMLGRIAAGAALPCAAPGPDAERDGAVLDSASALCRLGGDAALLREIENDFLRQYPRKLRLISLCSDNENWDEATLAAHSLKNVAGAVGAESSRRLAGRLEECLRSSDAAAAQAVLTPLKQSLAAAGAGIKASHSHPDRAAG